MRRYIAILLIVLPTVCLAEEYPPIDFHTDGMIQDGNEFSIVQTFDNSTVNMTGGGVHDYLFMFNNSTFNAYGGSMEEATISVSDYAILNLYSMELTPESIYTQGSYATINVYGKNFLYEQYSSDWWLHGNWSNNEEFILKLRGPWTRDYVVLREIPEPTSIIFMGLSYILLTIKKHK